MQPPVTVKIMKVIVIRFIYFSPSPAWASRLS